MEKQKYHSIEEAVGLIDEPNRQICLRFLKQNKELLQTAYGSKANHQAWKGGYIDHITEVMNIAITLYESLNQRRVLPFSLSDALLILFLHDLEKPWKYTKNLSGEWDIKPEMKDKKYIQGFVKDKIKEYTFTLTPQQNNGLEYVEGEHLAWTPGKRTMGPLAAFAHMCDTWSARGWYEYPKNKEEW